MIYDCSKFCRFVHGFHWPRILHFSLCFLALFFTSFFFFIYLSIFLCHLLIFFVPVFFHFWKRLFHFIDWNIWCLFCFVKSEIIHVFFIHPPDRRQFYIVFIIATPSLICTSTKEFTNIVYIWFRRDKYIGF